MEEEKVLLLIGLGALVVVLSILVVVSLTSFNPTEEQNLSKKDNLEYCPYPMMAGKTFFLMPRYCEKKDLNSKKN